MTSTQPTDYELLRKQTEALIGSESDALANTANFVALIFDNLHSVNWVGVYVLRGSELVLGPFQGKPACIRLRLGAGVCGTAAANMASLRVPDVHAFDGHVACDPMSRSELVVPLVCNGQVVGVLDLDSPFTNRFSADDQAGVESLCAAFTQHLEASGGSFI